MTGVAHRWQGSPPALPHPWRLVLSRRHRAAALAGLSITLLAATGCAHSGVEMRVPEANNTDLPRNGVVHYNYPHAVASAPVIIVYPGGKQQK